MEFIWSRMSSIEKDKLVGEKVLNFNCFSTKEDIKWYERHHKMGFWNYSTNLKNTEELLEVLANRGIQSLIHMESPISYHCKFFTDKNNYKNIPFCSKNTLPDVICVASLIFYGVTVLDE